jgi:hypothetical protein
MLGKLGSDWAVMVDSESARAGALDKNSVFFLDVMDGGGGGGAIPI